MPDWIWTAGAIYIFVVLLAFIVRSVYKETTVIRGGHVSAPEPTRLEADFLDRFPWERDMRDWD